MQPTIFVYSKHPLALQSITKAIRSDKVLCAEAAICCTSEKPGCEREGQILLLDTCSQEQWLEIALEWEQAGGHIVVLVPQRESRRIEHVRSLYVGVRGIVSISLDLEAELPKALRTVLQGRLWIHHEILGEYVLRTTRLMQKDVGGKPLLTQREEQIVLFIESGYSNKQIASALRISERTVKFHVSNSLQKFCVRTRKELLRALNSFGSSADFPSLPATFRYPSQAMISTIAAVTHASERCS